MFLYLLRCGPFEFIWNVGTGLELETLLTFVEKYRTWGYQVDA